MRILRARFDIRSLAVMGLATLLAIAWGEVASRHAPQGAIWFLVAGVTSALALALAAFGPFTAARAAGRSDACRLTCFGLATIAGTLVGLDALSVPGPAAAVVQVLLVAPFLLGAGCLARHRADFAAAGAAGFYATAVAMIYANGGTGWVGFWGVHIR